MRGRLGRSVPSMHAKVQHGMLDHRKDPGDANFTSLCVKPTLNSQRFEERRWIDASGARYGNGLDDFCLEIRVIHTERLCLQIVRL
jgi:hypothetical protein